MEKIYETVLCECGHDCPIDYAIIDEDANYTCVKCYMEIILCKLECPECHSNDIVYSRKIDSIYCHDCDKEFKS
jgi:hypothetical protein